MSEDNLNLVHNLATMWGNKLLAASRMAIVSSGYKVSGVLDTLKSIVHMDSDLTLTAFNRTDSPSSPPMFLVANQVASSRTVQIRFNSSIVAGWSPMVGCTKQVLRHVRTWCTVRTWCLMLVRMMCKCFM